MKIALQQVVAKFNLLKNKHSEIYFLKGDGGDLAKDTFNNFGSLQSLPKELLMSSKMTIKQLSDIRKTQLQGIFNILSKHVKIKKIYLYIYLIYNKQD